MRSAGRHGLKPLAQRGEGVTRRANGVRDAVPDDPISSAHRLHISRRYFTLIVIPAECAANSGAYIDCSTAAPSL